MEDLTNLSIKIDDSIPKRSEDGDKANRTPSRNKDTSILNGVEPK
jgi:hypothetical protein